MTLYVPVRRLNGRNDFYHLATTLNKLGVYGDYNPGGWDDYTVGTVVPHLRFEDEEDATVFAIHTGNQVYKSIPVETKE